VKLEISSGQRMTLYQGETVTMLPDAGE